MKRLTVLLALLFALVGAVSTAAPAAAPQSDRPATVFVNTADVPLRGEKLAPRSTQRVSATWTDTGWTCTNPGQLVHYAYGAFLGCGYGPNRYHWYLSQG